MENVVRNLDFAQTQELRKEELRNKIDKLMNVSTVPTVLRKIMELTDDPNASIHELEKVIERDQAIAMKVVAVSNGAYYGFSRKISSISQAIFILGFDMVRGLAITTTVFNSIPAKNKESLLALWVHSFETAQAAMLIAKRTRLVEKESAFLAGLFHDIGRPILFQACENECHEINPFEENPIEKEEEVFGASHAEVGSWFAGRFNLPEDSIKAIECHHNLKECAGLVKDTPLAAIIHLANLIVTEGPQAITAEHASILASLKIELEDIAAIAEEISGLKEGNRSFYL